MLPSVGTTPEKRDLRHSMEASVEPYFPTINVGILKPAFSVVDPDYNREA